MIVSNSARKKGITVAEAEAMPVEKLKKLTKAAVWPTPDWVGMHADDVEADVALIRYAVYHTLYASPYSMATKKPRSDSAYFASYCEKKESPSYLPVLYVKVLNALRAECESWRNKEDLYDFFARLEMKEGPLADLLYKQMPEWKGPSGDAVFTSVKSLFSFCENVHGQHYLEVWLKSAAEDGGDRSVMVSQTENLIKNLTRAVQWDLDIDFYGHLALSAEQKFRRAQAKEAAVGDEIGHFLQHEAQPVTGDTLTPFGLDGYRRGANVQEEDFKTLFGIQSVSFSGKVSDAEKQRALNGTYDAFCALADALGIPYPAVGMLPAKKQENSFGIKLEFKGSSPASFGAGTLKVPLKPGFGTQLARAWADAFYPIFSHGSNAPYCYNGARLLIKGYRNYLEATLKVLSLKRAYAEDEVAPYMEKVREQVCYGALGFLPFDRKEEWYPLFLHSFRKAVCEFFNEIPSEGVYRHHGVARRLFEVMKEDAPQFGMVLPAPLRNPKPNDLDGLSTWFGRLAAYCRVEDDLGNGIAFNDTAFDNYIFTCYDENSRFLKDSRALWDVKPYREKLHNPFHLFRRAVSASVYDGMVELGMACPMLSSTDKEGRMRGEYPDMPSVVPTGGDRVYYRKRLKDLFGKHGEIVKKYASALCEKAVPAGMRAMEEPDAGKLGGKPEGKPDRETGGRVQYEFDF